ncbi:hypothetical protein RN001_001313 [Aquatica leii]|uniref:Ig-like domain-containing protein n=1 Tax=Aquatica leii TaxID=1421715 RepID=A0AAN7PFX1_9COLE|nr:hypothetical protein RN001_001313 [Aquatica leii]
MQIVIWYKEGIKKKQSPIYTFDSRDKPIDQGKHWADESVLGGRAFFRYSDYPSKLTIDIVKDADAGVYLCRVDFQKTPTRNSKVNLTIIIPPEKLRILDERGIHIPHYILGPYNEGVSVNITCVATGGRPPPKVTWWQENALLDDSCEYLSEKRVRNILHLERLQRRHLHSVFTCQASNNNLIAPISSSVTLDMNLRPLWVKLLGENRPLSAENSYELSCEVIGSRPAPTITWWKGSVQMINTRETSSLDGNKTTSVLTFVPSIEDAGKYLSCRGQQQFIADSGIEDGWRLDIHHVPLVTLELGSNLNGSTIREGVDVYFECNIKSNPWVYRVSWRHNGKVLHNNPAVGTIVSNQSLVLQSVTRNRAGLYTCVGSNQEGDGESNPVQLDVKYAPLCKTGQIKSYGVARLEVADVRCELDANPTDIQFSWKFNNSDNTALIVELSQNLVTADRSRSILSYKPIGEYDYGTLLCSGRNEVGEQKEPCVFYINPAGKPDALSNCTIQNQTSESLYVECVEGFDGGLHQEFIMEIYHVQSHKLISVVSSKNPVFVVGGLESGVEFDVQLYASNKKGKSAVVRLQAFTLKSAEKHIATTTSVPLHISPLLGALIGIVSALVLIAIIIIIVIRLRHCRNEPDFKTYDDEGLSLSVTQCTATGADKSNIEPNLDVNGSIESLEEKNPDIIPHNTEEPFENDNQRYVVSNNDNMRSYPRFQTPVVIVGQNSHYEEYRTPEQSEEQFTQLSIPHHGVPYIIYNKSTHNNVLYRQDGMLYSGREASSQVLPCLQPLSPPYTMSTLQRKQRQGLHPHLSYSVPNESIVIADNSDQQSLRINTNLDAC